ncbi:MAG: aldehyde dehydrogenase [Chloroflexota bacterium]
MKQMTHIADHENLQLKETMLINGDWVSSGQRERLPVENPANEAIIGTIAAGTKADADTAIAAAHLAQPAWAAKPAVERSRLIAKLADAVLSEREKLARLLSLEQGKLYSEALGEVGATANFLTFAAEAGRRIEGEIFPSDFEQEQILIQRVPYGVTVGLLAWNFPLALAGRKVGPALVTGNSMVLKPHPNTPLTVLEFGRIAQEVGIPPGVLNVVTGLGEVVGDALVRHPLTRLVTLTGSTRAGSALYHAAADNITALRLELGGKAPFIVLEDADIEKAVEAAIVSRFTNCGQICTCNERMYLHEAIYEPFMDRFLAKVKQIKVGDAFSDATMGPKVSRFEVEKVAAIVNRAKAQGANVLAGGSRLTDGIYSKGYWYAPTVLTVEDPQADILHEEIFGPVVPVQKISSAEEALALANDSEYGLSAYLFTNRFKTIMQSLQQLEFGEIYVNRGGGELVQGFHNGFKKSGIGGEDGKHGLENYLQKKTCYINFG